MVKFLAAFMFVIIFVAGEANLDVRAAAVNDKATWLWNPMMIVNDEQEALTFLEQKQVNKVYIQIDRKFSQKVYQNFIQHAAGKGIRVYALDGAPEWCVQNGLTDQSQLMSWLANYQKASSKMQQFAGVHLDVEPYLYNGWTTNQQETIKDYQAMLMKAKNSLDALHLPIEMDMPFWFDQISYKNSYGKGLLSEWVIAHTSGVTIMAYRDSASEIINLVNNEISYAGKLGKSIDVGVETQKSAEGNDVSFFEEGETYMNQELSKVSNHFARVAGFNGIAVHHVGSWMTMKP
ncbi:amidase [Bacillus sp. BRMEA1]|uniref:amidase n=1 Tax=Neobacillus endophyticus TaxID=2738405 RepID=UPI001563DA6D|nr:amidase [Neobacillus endophyticus]NRD77801.1 amidase [Neobacillus endophyticus]